MKFTLTKIEDNFGSGKLYVIRLSENTVLQYSFGEYRYATAGWSIYNETDEDDVANEINYDFYEPNGADYEEFNDQMHNLEKTFDSLEPALKKYCRYLSSSEIRVIMKEVKYNLDCVTGF